MRLPLLLPRLLLACAGSGILAFGVVETSRADAGPCVTVTTWVRDTPTEENPSPPWVWSSVACGGTCPQGPSEICTCMMRTKVAGTTVPPDSPNHPLAECLGQTCSCWCVPSGGGGAYWAVGSESACFTWVYSNPTTPTEHWYSDCATVGCNPTNCEVEIVNSGQTFKNEKCICK